MNEPESLALDGIHKTSPLKISSSFWVLSAFALWCLTALMIFNQALQWPYLGARFSADIAGHAIIVDKVIADGPAEKAGLKAGDRIVALRNPDEGETYSLTGLEAIAGRHQLYSYEMVIAADRAIRKTWKFLEQDKVELVTDDDRTFVLHPSLSRPLWSLPIQTFTALAQSLLILLINAGIYAFAARSKAVNLLALSGLGLVGNTLSNSLIGARELVLAPQTLNFIYLINSFSLLVFTYGLLALLWHFPTRISRFPFATITFLIVLFIQYTQYFGLLEFPVHVFQLPNLLPFPLAIVISIIQWRRTAGKPVERASVMWFMLTIYGITSLVTILYSVPIMLRYPPLLSPHVASFTLSLIFIGIAAGTLRYRLFDIHRIWWRAIVWMAGGFGVVLADILLISQFDLEQAKALPFALFLAGWTYFPLRQAVLQYFVGSRNIKIADHVPDMIKTFSTIEDSDEFDGRFIAFLRRVFKAADIGPVSRTHASSASLDKNGLVLRVPSLSGNGVLELVGKSGGRQLFSPNDIRVANSFTRLIRNMNDARERENTRLQDDRDRIVRDLHDDVGGRLLNLIYRAKENSVTNEARATLKALKETLIVVEDTQSFDFSVVWDEICANAAGRLKSTGKKLSETLDINSERVLSAREYINLTRIVQEIVSNAIKYAGSDEVSLSARVDANGTLELVSGNSCSNSCDEELSGRRGLANIRKRIEEIGGHLNIAATENRENEKTFTIRLVLPLSE